MALTNATTLADYGAGIGTQGATLKVDATNKRVGVGTDSPAGPEGSLQVGTGITFFGNTGIVSAIGGKFSGDFTVGGTLTYEDVANIDAVGIITAQSGVSIADSIFHTGDDNTAIRFPAADTFTVETGGTERVRVTSAGKFGVGLTPSMFFEVLSDENDIARFSGPNSGGIVFRNDTSNEVQIHTGTSDALIFGTNGENERLRITSAGSVAIGVNSPSDKLHVGGNNAFIRVDRDNGNPGLTLMYNSTNSTRGDIDVTTGGDLRFATNSSTERLRITSAGNIGINSTDPTSYANSQATLVIEDDTNPAFCISDTGQARDWFFIGLGDGFGVRYADGGGSGSAANITNAVFIRNDGRIGLNDSAPERALDIRADNVMVQLEGTGGNGRQYSLCSTDDVTGSSVGQAGQFVIYDDTSGVNRLNIDSSGRVLIACSTPPNSGVNAGLQIQHTSTANITLARDDSSITDGNALGRIDFYGNDGGTFEHCATIVAQADGAHANGDKPMRLVFGTSADGAASPTERLRITSGGNVLFGNYFTSKQIGSFESSLQIQGTTGNTSSMSIFRYSADAGGSNLTLGKGRGSAGGVDKPNSGDTIGAIRFQIANNNNLTDGESAKIEAVVDDAPGGGDYPSRLSFYTTPDGGNSVVERMRIDRNGRVHIGDRVSAGNAAHFSTATVNISKSDDIATSFSKTACYLHIGNASSTLNGVYPIGFGFSTNDRTHVPAYIQYITEDSGGAEHGPLTFATRNVTTDTEPTERMRITSGGSILIGQTNESFGNVGHILNASGQHYVIASGDTPLLINRQSNDGELIRLAQDGSTEGSVTVSGGNVTYGQFCGSHWGRLEDDSKPEILVGTILETVNKLIEWKVVEFTVDGVQKRQAYNGSAEVGDVNVSVTYEGTSYTGTIANEQENLPRNKHVCVKVSDTAASKAVFGVFLGWDETPEEEVIGTWNDMNIAAIGNYFIRIKSGQSLEIGDLIESDGSGCGVVQSDDTIRSKTVAKVTSTIPQTVYSDGSFLVTCVLYSG